MNSGLLQMDRYDEAMGHKQNQNKAVDVNMVNNLDLQLFLIHPFVHTQWLPCTVLAGSPGANQGPGSYLKTLKTILLHLFQ